MMPDKPKTLVNTRVFGLVGDGGATFSFFHRSFLFRNLYFTALFVHYRLLLFTII